MRNEWEVRRELQLIIETEKKVEDRVKSALQPVHSLPDSITQSVEITKDYLNGAIRSLTKQLVNDFKNQRVLLLGLMDGAGFFADQLMRAIEEENEGKSIEEQFDIEYVTMRTSSYHGTESGQLKLDSFKEEVGERVVVVLDDILDTGKTLAGVIECLKNKGASKVYTMVLFDKVIEGRTAQADYHGVRVTGEHFYVGAGMDYLTPRFRRLPALYAVDRSTLATEEEEAILSKKGALNLELETIIKAGKGTARQASTAGYSVWNIFSCCFRNGATKDSDQEISAPTATH